MIQPELCPECKGKCCRSDLGYRVEHMGAEFYAHNCNYCHEGTVPSPTPYLAAERLSALLDAERENTALRTEMGRLRGEVERERADVVAYLAYARKFPFHYHKDAPAILDALRELIEQGHHEGWAERETKDKEQTPENNE